MLLQAFQTVQVSKPCLYYANRCIYFSGSFSSQHIFKWEQEEYRKEGINWKEIAYVDNKPLLVRYNTIVSKVAIVLFLQCVVLMKSMMLDMCAALSLEKLQSFQISNSYAGKSLAWRCVKSAQMPFKTFRGTQVDSVTSSFHYFELPVFSMHGLPRGKGGTRSFITAVLAFSSMSLVMLLGHVSREANWPVQST